MEEEEEGKRYLLQLFRLVPALAAGDAATIPIFFYRMNPVLRRIRPADVEEVEELGRSMNKFFSYTWLATSALAVGNHSLLSRYWPTRYPRKLLVLGHYSLHLLLGGLVASTGMARFERQKAAVISRYHFTADDVQQAADFLEEEVRRGRLYLQDEALNYNDGSQLVVMH